MSRVYLIRHAKPAQSFGQGNDEDPGLDDTGKAQAEAAAQALLALPEGDRPKRVVSSPLRRCRETAEPYAMAIGVEVEIDPFVGEIPTPKAYDAVSRGPWLRKAFQGKWSEIEGDLDYDEWRREVAHAVAARGSAAVFSHYVAINAVFSTLADDDRVIVFRPDHASISVFDRDEGQLSLVQPGREANTSVM